MKPLNNRNTAKVPYFPLEEYVKNIKIEENVLNHMEDTSQKFDEYLKKLSEYGNYSILYYWLDSLYNEIIFSNNIENHRIARSLIFNDEVFFESLNISHNRIKQIHKYITEDDKLMDYRHQDVRVSSFNNGKEDIFWYGANYEDIPKFMKDFINIYKRGSLSVLDNNPFLKSSLMHFLFVRIHPFLDGNGRTARMIHNIKFTQLINNAYKSNLRICPLNLSQSILLNKVTYVNKINSIYFDLEHDCNTEINDWFDFILDMADEQLYYSEARLPGLAQAFSNIAGYYQSDDFYANYAKKMKLFK